jgi:ABC-type spermidine/putrescine transport system permease subunit I
VKEDRHESPLPLRATGIVLGVWMAVLITIAFVVVPALFGSCQPTGNPVPSPAP